MSKKNITTIKGEELPISQAKKFPTGYYKIGDINVENSGDCYKVNNKFYRIETGQIIFNHSIKQYQLLTQDVIFGIIENNQLGYFNRNEQTKIPVILENGTKTFAQSEEILKKNLNFREQLSTGDFIHISKLNCRDFNKIVPPKNEYKTSLPYDSNGITKKHLDIYNNLYDSNLNIYCYQLGKYLGDLTFGLEFETVAGFVPERITKKLGLIPLRDGSIPGLEYVTVPLSGSKGIQTIVDICKELKNRTKYDNSCALHLHIGGIPRTPEFILAFLKVSSWLQNDIFTLFPLYKKYNLGIKNKNYSKPYDMFEIFNGLDPVINNSNITKNFDNLFSFLTSDKSKFNDYGNDLNNVNNHPLDPSSNQKWNIKTRYFFHNFIPLIFGNKQTIEFRIHTPTFDYYRILMFLLFNSLMIKFTLKYQKNILEQPDFFKKINNQGDSRTNLFNLLYFYRNNESFSNEVTIMMRSLYNYFQLRKQKSEILTRQGKIEYEDSDIYFNEEFCFDFGRTIKSEKSNIKLDNGMPVNLEEISPSLQINTDKKTELRKKISSIKEENNPYTGLSKTIEQRIEELKNDQENQISKYSLDYTKAINWIDDYGVTIKNPENKNK